MRSINPYRRKLSSQIIIGIVMMFLFGMLGLIIVKENEKQYVEIKPVKSMEGIWLSDETGKELIDHPSGLDEISFKENILNDSAAISYAHEKVQGDPQKGFYAIKLKLFVNSYENLILHIDGIYSESFYIYGEKGKLLYKHLPKPLTQNYTTFLSEIYVHNETEVLYIVATHNKGNSKVGFTKVPTLMNTSDALIYMTDSAQARHSVALFLLLISIILVIMAFTLASTAAKNTIKGIAIFTGLFGLWILTDFSRYGFWIVNSFSAVPAPFLIFIYIVSRNYMTCAFVKMNGFFLEKEISKKIAKVLVIITFIVGSVETLVEIVRFFEWNSILLKMEFFTFSIMNWTIILGSIGLLGLTVYESYKGSIRAIILSGGLSFCLFTFFISQTTTVLISHWGVIVLLTTISIILTNNYNEAQRKSREHTEMLRTKNSEMEQLNKDLEYAQTELLLRLGGTMDLRSRETSMHVERVSMYTELIARKMGLENETADLIAKASTLHDVGKVGTPDSILNSPRKLTEEEYTEMKRHAKMGYEILNGSRVEILDVAATIALTHHERYDGAGYPEGLSGENIPIQGRIVAAADVFDALLSPRVYKKGWTLKDVLGYFAQERGKHFDPQIADIVIMHQEAFEEIINKIPYE